MRQKLIASFTANRLHALWHDVGRMTANLPFATLLPLEAQHLGGFLFPGASELVTKVGRALLYHPALFQNGAAIGKGLLGRQARADALLDLRDRFQDLADRLGDAHQQEQAQATKDALSILNDIKARAGIAHPPHEQRRIFRQVVALAGALKLLDDYRQGLLKIRAHNKTQRELAEETNPIDPHENPAPPPPSKSAQKLRSEQQARDYRASQTDGAFLAHLRLWDRLLPSTAAVKKLPAKSI